MAGKIHRISNFGKGQMLVAEQKYKACRGVILDPLRCGFAAIFLAHLRKILRGDKKQTSVELYFPMLHTIYKDEFVKQNGQWLIKHRKSNFMWREVEEVE